VDCIHSDWTSVYWHGRCIHYTVGYLLLITPPPAIDLTVSQRTSSSELARQPFWVVMLIELLIRVALILRVAVGLESVFGDAAYETYWIDTMFIIVFAL
jgi:hypothetical protein